MHLYSIDPFAAILLQTFQELIDICHASLRQIVSEKRQMVGSPEMCCCEAALDHALFLPPLASCFVFLNNPKRKQLSLMSCLLTSQ